MMYPKHLIEFNMLYCCQKCHHTLLILSSRLNKSIIGLVAISATETAASSINSNNNSNSFIQTNGNTVTIASTNLSSAVRNGSNYQSDKSNKNKLQDVVKILKQSNVICFDVDSTVICEEGIDELASFCGRGNEVSLLTKEAMKGSMTFQDALRLRLNIIKPSQRQIKEFLKLHPSKLSIGIRELIMRLKSRNTTIYLISGGFDCLIEPVGIELGIPPENIYANKLLFYFNGDYAGFDINQPTSHSGGKGEAISRIRSTLGEHIKITMIGDGATDLEASPPADHFIGYGGNIIREEVKNRAQHYITNFEDILEFL